jgi:hypothetical protein
MVAECNHTWFKRFMCAVDLKYRLRGIKNIYYIYSKLTRRLTYACIGTFNFIIDVVVGRKFNKQFVGR